MKKAFIGFLLIFTCLFLKAQDVKNSAQPQQLSLQQAIEYAYQHQGDMINAQIDADISNAKVKEVIGMGLPQLSGSFDVKDFEKIPTTTFPDFITPSVYNVLFDENVIPRKDLGSMQQFPIQFGTKWNATAGINASQLLFSPSYLVGVRASKSFRELSQKNVTRSKIETNVAVSKAYYNVLVSNERIKLLDANVTRVKKLKDDTEKFYENGFVEKIDLDRITLAYNSIVVEKGNAERFSKLSDYLLKFQLGMSMSDNVSLTDSLSYVNIANEPSLSASPDVTNRIEYSILNTQKNLQELDLKRYKVAYYPTIAAYGSVSANALRDKFDIFDGSKKWYPTAVIGATLSINLFDGTQRESKIRQASLSLRKTENEIAKAQDALTLEAITANTTYQNALESYRSQKENLDLANEVVRVSKIKYDQGVGSNLEVVQAETSLREAVTNYYNALYTVLVSKVDLNRSMGNIK